MSEEEDSVIVATRGDDGWVLGTFENLETAKKYVQEEVDHYDQYECDYWECVVGEGGSNLI